MVRDNVLVWILVCWPCTGSELPNPYNLEGSLMTWNGYLDIPTGHQAKKHSPDRTKHYAVHDIKFDPLGCAYWSSRSITSEHWIRSTEILWFRVEQITRSCFGTFMIQTKIQITRDTIRFNLQCPDGSGRRYPRSRVPHMSSLSNLIPQFLRSAKSMFFVPALLFPL